MVTALGWICAALGAALSLPQLNRLLRSGSSAGVSLLNWQLVAGSGIAWTVYGISVGHAPVWVPNALMGICALLIVRTICKDRSLSLVKSLLLPAGVTVAALAVYWLTNADIFGFVVNIPQMIGVLAQIRAIARDRDITGFSIGYMAMLSGVQYLWVIWSLFTHDGAIRVGGGAMAVLTTIAIITWLLRRAGVVGPKADAAPAPPPEAETATD